VPQFNFKGKGSMGTWYGLCVSINFYALLLTFALLKFIRLVKGSNPLISAAPDLDFYD
jgi:hypothetical protein